jgi:hypothetical protein
MEVWSDCFIFGGKKEKSFAPAGDQTLVIQSIVRHYTDQATPATVK